MPATRTLILLLTCLAVQVSAQTSGPASANDAAEEIRHLKALVEQLESRIERLEAQQSSQKNRSNDALAQPPAQNILARPSAASPQTISTADRDTLGFLHQATVNVEDFEFPSRSLSQQK